MAKPCFLRLPRENGIGIVGKYLPVMLSLSGKRAKTQPAGKSLGTVIRSFF
jgi:hypothetical protein